MGVVGEAWSRWRHACSVRPSLHSRFRRRKAAYLSLLHSDIGLDDRPDWWDTWWCRGGTQPHSDNLIESPTTDHLCCNSCPCVRGSAIFGNIQFKFNAIYSWAPYLIRFYINCCELTWTDVKYRWYMNVVELFRNGSILLRVLRNLFETFRCVQECFRMDQFIGELPNETRFAIFLTICYVHFKNTVL